MATQNQQITTDKGLLLISIFGSLFLTWMFLDYYVFKSTAIIVGVIRELITIPTMLGQFVVCVLAFLHWQKRNFQLAEYALFAFIISLGNSLFVIGSFIFI